MKRNHIWKIILLLLLMFMSSCGQLLTQCYEMGMDDNDAWGYSAFVSLLTVCAISLIMVAVPFIVLLIKRSKLDYVPGTRLCLWNSIIICVISMIVTFTKGYGLYIGGMGALIYYFINKWLFVKEKQKRPLPNLHNNDSVNGEYAETKLQNSQPITYDSMSQKPTKYCSKCGHKIDPVSKKCNGCGKQYFKGFSAKAVVIILLSLLLVLSCTGNILLYTANTRLEQSVAKLVSTKKELQHDISALETEKTQLNSKYQSLLSKYNGLIKQFNESSDKSDFVDRYVVIVADNGTNLFHKYDCSTWHGYDCWIYNTEAAESKGYKPCPSCCK